jgi:F-type H+-transporting ATPase subunit b
MFRKLPRTHVWIFALAALLATARPVFAADSPEAPQPGLISPDVSACIWVLISFTLVLVILYKAAWKNVLQGLKDRETRITGNIAHAEAANSKAEATLKEYAAKLAAGEEQVRLLLAKAAADADKIANNIRAQAQADGEAERAKSRKEIESAKAEAIRQVYEQTADLATNVASKIIGRNLNAQDQQDLVNQTLGQLEAMGRK